MYTMEYYAAVKNEGTFIFCNSKRSIDGPGDHYAK